MRIYYGQLLQGIGYYPQIGERPAEFRYKIIRDFQLHGIYEAPTIQGIIDAIKADGHVIWFGERDPMDYTRPEKAMEFLLYQMANNLTDEEMHERFKLK